MSAIWKALVIAWMALGILNLVTNHFQNNAIDALTVKNQTECGGTAFLKKE